MSWSQLPSLPWVSRETTPEFVDDESVALRAVEAVTADSPSLARRSLAEARAFCAERGIRHRVVETDEFDSINLHYYFFYQGLRDLQALPKRLAERAARNLKKES